MVKKIVELTEEISQSSIAYWKKEELRTNLKNMKKQLDDMDRANKAAVVQEVIEQAKQLLEGNSHEKFIVHAFEAGSNAKALDGALKQVKSLCPRTAAMFFSTDNGKVLCLSSVPKEAVSKGLKANEWVREISRVIDGKGGGKEEAAQATGTRVSSLNEAMTLAKEFAELKLTQ
ncbi:alanine--tRNA ligase, cytoplasmic-like [Limulus polyphemus]|uniref:Alanine--tRNA ligase, cytoplasmic-like n=1 Tax=Limulus polyphemus TaxID=6850 RepID=A0ABM1THL0_LIMPO|nr:alanine--tRNA ligase, cytoplasmic-like [Limulus polyphemus]